MIHITATAHAGSLISNCIDQAITTACMVYLSPLDQLSLESLARHLTSPDFYELKADGEAESHGVGEVDMTFDFNGVKVTVKADSDPELIYRDWSRALNGYIDKSVGPYPSPVLTDEEKESDARIEAENERKRQERQAEYAAKAKAHRERVEARMVNAPEMEFADKTRWDEALPQTAESLYGTSIATYAERWARMMQLELSEGKELTEVWIETSHEADLEGMTGYSQGVATHLLTETWVHGAELRRLHNAYWGSNSTDGTVNPAVITGSTD